MKKSALYTVLVYTILNPLVTSAQSNTNSSENTMPFEDIKMIVDEVKSVDGKIKSLGNKINAAGSGSAGLLDFANELSQYSDDPGLQQTVKDLNDVHEGVSYVKDIFAAGGAGAQTGEFFDNAQLVMQAGVVLYNLFKKEEPVLTQGQKNAMKYSMNLSDKVKGVYVTVSRFPKQYSYTAASMELINAYEAKLNSYDKKTAMQRLLIWKYMESKDVPELNVVQGWVPEIIKMEETKGIDYIKSQIDEYAKKGNAFNSILISTKADGALGLESIEEMLAAMGESKNDNFIHLRNGEQSLKHARVEILLFKSQYYYQAGDEAMAIKMLDQLASTATYEDMKKVINAAFGLRNYKTAAQYYPLFFAQWYKKVSVITNKDEYKAYMNDIPVVARGIVSLTKNGQHTNAAAHMQQVLAVYNDFLLKPKKRSKYDFSVEDKSQLEKVYFWHAEAEILQKQGKLAEALSKIDSAIYHAETKLQMFGEGFYIYRLKESKIDILIAKKEFDKAMSECAATQRTYNASAFGPWSANNYSATTFKFQQAVIFYNMGKYQPALNTLTVVKSMDENIPKAYLLEKEIYLAMNDPASAKKSEEKLKTLYNK